ncbi:MAG: hypothetical protein M3N46_01700 [Actinomycetota bacterium]|nr:hypothetical protein [Actinomycetota bacterium]
MSLSPASTITASVGSGHANEVVLKHLGAITITSARLERLAVEIAGNLKLVVGPAGATELLRRGDFTTPPWAARTPKDVAAWATAASRLLSIRNSVIAACGGSRFTGTRGDTIATLSADGSVFPADEEFLGRLVGRFERHLVAGAELRSGLDYQDENGRSWPLVTIYRRAVEEPTPENQLRLPAEWTRWLSA